MGENYDELVRCINELQAENDSFRRWQIEITNALKQMLSNFEKQNEYINRIQQGEFINRIRIESLPYEMRDYEYKSPVYIPRIKSVARTRRDVIDNRRSISRFGDGEFGIIAGIGRWRFQKASDRLAEKLIRVLKSDEVGHIVGLNRNFYGNLEHLSEVDADGVRTYMRPNVRKFHAELLSTDRIYGNLMMNCIENEQDVTELKELWNDKDCVFVEGRHTGMGVGNDLFDNCRSIERIIAPAENAIDRYDDIIAAVQKQSRDKLILLALGPTATALAYDLYKDGYWAVDIGHVDLYYEKYIRKLANLEDVSIAYKYCNWDEVRERQIDDIEDEKYKAQITDIVY